MSDIYMVDDLTGEAWNFVFGVANQHIKAGVFSFARYDDNFWADTQGTAVVTDWETILYRAVKVMVHEIGHMFGIKHCVYFECVMNGSNGEEENSRKPMQLCAICLRKF